MTFILHRRLPCILVVTIFARLNNQCGPISCLSLAASSKKSKRSTGGGGFGASSSSSKSRPLVLEPDDSPEIVHLMEYLKSQKAEVDHVAVGRHPQHGRGLYATKTFSKTQGGQVLCKVPSDCALALSDPSEDKQRPLSFAEEGANLLQLYLNNEERQSQFSAYLDTLPKEITDPTPDLFDENDELPLLEFPRVINKAKERRQEIERVAKEQGIASIKELQYASWLVASRSYRLAVSSDGETVAEMDDRGQVLTQPDEQRQWIRVLVPLLDMVNHADPQPKQEAGTSTPPNARMVILDPQKDNAWFALQSTRPIPAGTEIRVAYGSGLESAVELLLNYGFVPNAAASPSVIDAMMLQKGGEDCFSSINDWTTTLEEDETMLQMMQQEQTDDATSTNILAKILSFRIRLKKAYSLDLPNQK